MSSRARLGRTASLASAQSTAARGRWAFAALGLGIVAWSAVMCALEPVMLDGWFIDSFEGSVLEYARANRAGELFWGNARLGQLVTAFTYEPAIHVIVTPLCVLALFVLMLVHVRGRWPVAGSNDAWMLLVLLGVTVLAQPQLGPVLFYRPYAANYLFGLVVQLAWLVPYRFALAREPRGSFVAAAAMLVLGVAAGACNEHTGPALAVAAAIVVVRFARQRRLRVWMIAGLVGFVAGYLALMLAPGQATRYCGVAELSLPERIADRGLAGNLEIAFAVLWEGRWAWLALVVAAIALRRSPPRRREAVLWIALGVAVSLTLLASPKQGDRLLFAPLVFATIGIAILVEDLAADCTRARLAIAVIAGGALATAIVWSTAIRLRVATDYDHRHRLLAAAAPGAIVQLPMLRDRDSRWFLGDDLRSDRHRHFVAERHRLDAIELAGHPTIPFHYEVRTQLAGTTPSVRRFGPLQQLCEARRDFADELAALRTGGQLARAELAIAPRSPILAGRELAASRWRDGRLISPSASVVNEQRVRWITIDRGGLTGPLDVILVGPGREERLQQDGERWPYRPWGPGTYWIIACAATDCYLAETVRHTQV